MDQPRSEPDLSGAEITLTPDMRPGANASPRTEKPKREAASRQPRTRTGRAGTVLGTLGLLAGLTALGGTAWLYQQSQREVLRLSTELAQLRVSLDLYARNATASAAPAPATTQAEPTATTALPDIAPEVTPSPPAQTATSSGEDCLPAGMRLLVAAGDSYPICDQPITIDVGAVDNGYVMLADGTTIPSGGSLPLVGTQCTIGVTSSGDEGLTGYAEIRVTC